MGVRASAQVRSDAVSMSACSFLTSADVSHQVACTRANDLQLRRLRKGVRSSLGQLGHRVADVGVQAFPHHQRAAELLVRVARQPGAGRLGEPLALVVAGTAAACTRWMRPGAAARP